MKHSQETIVVFTDDPSSRSALVEYIRPFKAEYAHWVYFDDWQYFAENLTRSPPTCAIVCVHQNFDVLSFPTLFAFESMPVVFIEHKGHAVKNAESDDANAPPLVVVDTEAGEVDASHANSIALAGYPSLCASMGLEPLNLETLTTLKLFSMMAVAIKVHQLMSFSISQVQQDSLTGLINRELLLNRLGQSLRRCNRYRERCALLCLNVNQFKSINEKYGHLVGDQLLKQVAERVLSVCRNTDSVARLNGDEFVVLIENADKNIGRKVAEKLQRKLTEPYNIHEHVVTIGVAMGMAAYPDTAVDAEELLKQAGQALDKAKASREVSFVSFSERHKSQLYRRHVLEQELKRAIDQDELKLVYQPIVCAKTHEIRRIEALSRWPREDFNVPAPELIEMVDRLNLTDAFHHWLFHAAFSKLSQWQSESVFPELCLNIPANYCYSDTISKGILRALSEFNLTPRGIELEITESTLMRYPDRSIRVLNALHQEGIRIAVDDFGTGFSCMSYLTSLPIDTLKIDRDFFLARRHLARNKKVIDAITALGHSLGFEIIAEGVETEAQLALAKGVHCDLLQGYYFGRPESATGTWLEYVSQFPSIVSGP